MTMILRLVILTLSCTSLTAQESTLRDLIRKSGRGKALETIRKLPRDSMIALAKAMAEKTYPGFDPRLFSSQRVYTNGMGVFVSWSMAIRWVRPGEPAIYDVHVNLLGPTIGGSVSGRTEGSGEFRIFRWDDDGRTKARSILRLDDSTAPVLEDYRYPDGQTVTIYEYEDYYLISKEAPGGGFESYKLDKYTRRMWDYMTGTPGAITSEDIEIEE